MWLHFYHWQNIPWNTEFCIGLFFYCHWHKGLKIWFHTVCDPVYSLLTWELTTWYRNWFLLSVKPFHSGHHHRLESDWKKILLINTAAYGRHILSVFKANYPSAGWSLAKPCTNTTSSVTEWEKEVRVKSLQKGAVMKALPSAVWLKQQDDIRHKPFISTF